MRPILSLLLLLSLLLDNHVRSESSHLSEEDQEKSINSTELSDNENLESIKKLNYSNFYLFFKFHSKFLILIQQKYIKKFLERLNFGQKCEYQYECTAGLMCKTVQNEIAKTCRCSDENLKWSTKYNRCVDCPKDWIFYNEDCYLVSDHAKTWNDAQKECKMKKSNLISISSRVILDFWIPFYEINNLDGSYLVNFILNKD